MTPELTLGGGYTGSLGNIGYGYDGACNCYYTDNADVDFESGRYIADAFDLCQWSDLSWRSPWKTLRVTAHTGIGASADDSSRRCWRNQVQRRHASTAKSPVSGKATATDLLVLTIIVRRIGAGVGFSLGDMAIHLAGARWASTNNDEDFWGASILAS